MTTIIGFIDPTQVPADIELPVGFLENGNRVNNALANCKLIFLDDRCDYNENWENFNGAQRDALLFQHNSNRSAWDAQETWLEQHGWKPRRFAGFSHNETEGEFMTATEKLLCNNDNCQAVIEDFSQRVSGKYIFKLLDNYVAWKILSSLNNDDTLDDDTLDNLRDAFDLLPEDISNNLSQNSLKEIINTANKQALGLIQ